MGHAQEPNDSPPPDAAAARVRFLRRSTSGVVRVVELHLPESLDSNEFDALNAALLEEMASLGAGRCVLDLTGVAYMGSSMLGLMVNARQRCKAGGGRLVLCGMSEWLVQTFRTSSLERLFVTAVSRDDAVKAAGRA